METLLGYRVLLVRESVWKAGTALQARPSPSSTPASPARALLASPPPLCTAPQPPCDPSPQLKGTMLYLLISSEEVATGLKQSAHEARTAWKECAGCAQLAGTECTLEKQTPPAQALVLLVTIAQLAASPTSRSAVRTLPLTAPRRAPSQCRSAPATTLSDTSPLTTLSTSLTLVVVRLQRQRGLVRLYVSPATTASLMVSLAYMLSTLSGTEHCIIYPGIKRKCPVGRYGSSSGLSSPSCSGYCAPGYYCEEGSPSATQYPCGGADRFCPPGSTIAQYVHVGYYTGTAALSYRYCVWL